MAVGAAPTRLGPYDIVARVGAGGMGQVFRAKDTRLGRTVAIKVLSDDVDARRLRQEARAISALNHPNICTLYDIGEQDGSEFLVMEYLDGETLAARLKRGRLPTEEALQFGREITLALEQAHRQGLIHRDLKPGNIMLVKSAGRTVSKLLDFGLAKAAGPANESVTLALTEVGAVVGTPLYMAPEQLQGKAADVRSDIYALGLVLREMLPNPTDAVNTVVARCLERDPESRWQSAGDVRAGLELATRVPEAASTSRKITIPLIAAAVATLVAAAAGAAIWIGRTPPAKVPVTFSFTAPPGTSLIPFRGALSPDGSQVAFLALDSSGVSQLWVRSLRATAPRLVADTRGASGPFWSPDGAFIGFAADAKLKRVPAGGGPVQNICPIATDLGATWSASGDIVLAPWNRTVLQRVSASGGTPQPLTVLDLQRQENSHRWPYFLPDGRHFLFTARSSVRENTAIYVGSRDSRDVKRVLLAQSQAMYAPPGYLLFAREGTLMVQRFDQSKLELTDEPLAIVGGLEHVTPSASAMFSVSADGSVLSWLEAINTKAEVGWFDRAGRKIAPILSGRDYLQPRLSPDGKLLAVVVPDPDSGNRDIWLKNLITGELTRFTSNPANDWHPVWSPDGAFLAFASDRTPHSSIYRKPVHGNDVESLVMSADENVFPDDYARDGSSLLYHQDNSAQRTIAIWLKPLTGSSTPREVARNSFDQRDGRLSPDGKSVAYVSNESGTAEVYVKPLDGATKVRVSMAGGSHPEWSHDGRELFYLNGASELMSAAVDRAGGIEVANQHALFRTCYGAHNLLGSESPYDVSADGQRFVFACRITGDKEPAITVQVGWQGMLKLP